MVDTIEAYGYETISAEWEIQSKYWENLMIRSIHNGANIHYCDQEHSTLLGNWIQTFHPLTTEDIIRRWVPILQSCGVDTARYLHTETQLYQAHQRLDSWKERGIRKRKMRLEEQGDITVIISWKGDFPGPCEEALKEFVAFGDDECFSPTLMYLVATEQDWKKYWPFSFNSVPNLRGWMRQKPQGSGNKHSERPCRTRDTGLPENEDGFLEIPGSWID